MVAFIAVCAEHGIGFMPGVGCTLSEALIPELAGYMHQRYAQGRPAWRDLPGGGPCMSLICSVFGR